MRGIKMTKKDNVPKGPGNSGGYKFETLQLHVGQ